MKKRILLGLLLLGTPITKIKADSRVGVASAAAVLATINTYKAYRLNYIENDLDSDKCAWNLDNYANVHTLLNEHNYVHAAHTFMDIAHAHRDKLENYKKELNGNGIISIGLKRFSNNTLYFVFRKRINKLHDRVVRLEAKLNAMMTEASRVGA